MEFAGDGQKGPIRRRLLALVGLQRRLNLGVFPHFSRKVSGGQFWRQHQHNRAIVPNGAQSPPNASLGMAEGWRHKPKPGETQAFSIGTYIVIRKSGKASGISK